MRQLILIAGGSASGKSTLAHALAARLGTHARQIAIDDYYRANASLSHAERRELDFDHPDAIEHELLLAHVADLLAGRTVDRPRYDFATHTRLPVSDAIDPAPVLIVEGLFALAWDALRQHAALGVFVSADEPLRRERRLRRDAGRGRSRQTTLVQLERTVLPAHARHVEPTATHADLIVPGHRPFATPVALIAAWLEAAVDTTPGSA